MAISNKFKTSNAAVCLKAIKDYIDMDEAIVSNEEQKQIKARAKKAMEHLPLLLSPETQTVVFNACPAEALPTIL
ncbi:MAG: hypothetical protein QG657_3415 [Acidobacteriota bacterium]|nr:hypothetical protein [Acidobacteriota bacterium]